MPAWRLPDCALAEAEALAGAHAAETLETRFGGVVDDPAAESRMARIGYQLYGRGALRPNAASYRILASDDLNALSLPGPRIYLTRRLYLLLTDDDLLAAVLAHELAHVEARDHFKERGIDAMEALQRELDADARAVGILRAAGMRASALPDALALVEDALPPGWAEERRAAMVRMTAAAGSHALPGDDASRGVVVLER